MINTMAVKDLVIQGAAYQVSEHPGNVDLNHIAVMS